MRLKKLILQAAGIKPGYRKALSKSPYLQLDAVRQLSATFGPTSNQLPPTIRHELLNQKLRDFPHRREFFEKLTEQGKMLLVVLFNEHLGTRNIDIPHSVLVRFTQLRGLPKEFGSADNSINFIHASIGAFSVLTSRDACRSAVNTLLEGDTGLSNLYLDALSRKQL